MTTTVEYLSRTVAPLVGATFVGLREGPMDDDRRALGHSEGELILVFRTKAGEELEVGVWSDDEGNANGWLDLPTVILPSSRQDPHQAAQAGPRATISPKRT